MNYVSDGTWNCIALIISSETKSVEEISEILNTPPSRFAIKNHPISQSTNGSRVFPDNKWILDSSLPDTEMMESHMEKMISFLDEKYEEVLKLSSDCQIEMRCAFSVVNRQGGYVLESPVLKKLAQFPLNVVVSLYS